MFLITYRLMHRQLLGMVEEPKIADTPSTEEGTYSEKLYNTCIALRLTDGKWTKQTQNSCN